MKKNSINQIKSDSEMFSGLSLISYIDENLMVVYAPALDLFGYGNDEKEATTSFELVFNEYMDYTSKKGILVKDLKKLGWTLNKKKRILASPPISDLLDQNETLKEIVNSKVFRKYNFNIPVPVRTS